MTNPTNPTDPTDPILPIGQLKCYMDCPECDGTGDIERADGDPLMCELCDGSGEVEEPT